MLEMTARVTRNRRVKILQPLLGIAIIYHGVVFQERSNGDFLYAKHILYLLLIARRSPLEYCLSVTETQYICIFCGNVPAIRLYRVDRLTNIRAGFTPGELGMPGAELNIDLLPHIRSRYYIDCNGCRMKYEDISSMDANSVLFDFTWDEQVAEDVNYYHGTTDVLDLLRNHRTGIARKKRGVASYLREPVSKNKILIPIMYNNRTYLSCQREKDANGRLHFKAYNLGRP